MLLDSRVGAFSVDILAKFPLNTLAVAVEKATVDAVMVEAVIFEAVSVLKKALLAFKLEKLPVSAFIVLD
jgi:hypothetical protein